MVDDVYVIKEKYNALAERLDEATLRLWAAVEARALGRGGVSAVAKAIGLSRTTIYVGLEELERKSAGDAGMMTSADSKTVGQRRVRSQGGTKEIEGQGSDPSAGS